MVAQAGVPVIKACLEGLGDVEPLGEGRTEMHVVRVVKQLGRQI